LLQRVDICGDLCTKESFSSRVGRERQRERKTYMREGLCTKAIFSVKEERSVMEGESYSHAQNLASSFFDVITNTQLNEKKTYSFLGRIL
jgi:uncharacterized protein Veg